MTDTLNLAQRRSAAKVEVAKATFRKVKSAEGGLKFPYLPVEQVKPVVEEALNNAGIVMDLGDLEWEDRRDPWEKPSPYGSDTTRWCHIAGTLTISLVNIDNPADRYTCKVSGEAKDNSDKAVNKLYTACIKNFYKIEYNIAESSKDDTDALQDDAAIERSNSAAPKKYDRFLNPGPAKADEVTADVEPAEMRERILKWAGQDNMKPIFADGVKAYGAKPAEWTDTEVTELYLRMVRAGRRSA